MIRRIGIFGHVGNGNLGDEAIIAAVIQNINQRFPNAHIYGITTNPADTQDRHKIAAFPINRVGNTTQMRLVPTIADMSDGRESFTAKVKTVLKKYQFLYAVLRRMKDSGLTFLGIIAELRFLIRCYRNVKGIDLFIVAGSQQLIDYVGGPWEHSYNVFKWVLLAKAAKAKIVFLSVGAGPVRSTLGKFFVRKSLDLASYRSYRDETSQKVVQELGLSGEDGVFPDLVYSLQINAGSSSSGGDETLPIVGVNPVPFFDGQYWEGASPHEYAAYIGKLASFALWVTQRGYRILFFPTQLRLDPPVIADIKNAMQATANGHLEGQFVNKPINSFDDLVSAISMTSIVVATRFHGIVIPYLLNRPVLGIAYQKKTNDLMTQMGQSEYVVDIKSFDVHSLQTRFISLESRSTTIRNQIKERNVAFRHALRNQYDQLLNLV
jgi:polysaccharide pyruvyl transferase WcaK-like protein